MFLKWRWFRFIKNIYMHVSCCLFLQDVSFKKKPNKNNYVLRCKNEIRSRSNLGRNLPTSLVTRVKANRVASPLLTLVAKNCASANMVCSQAERAHSWTLLRIEIIFCSSWSTSNTEVPNKTAPICNRISEHRIVYLWQVCIERQDSWNDGSTDSKHWISCKNGIHARDGVYVQSFRLRLNETLYESVLACFPSSG